MFLDNDQFNPCRIHTTSATWIHSFSMTQVLTRLLPNHKFPLQHGLGSHSPTSSQPYWITGANLRADAATPSRSPWTELTLFCSDDGASEEIDKVTITSRDNKSRSKPKGLPHSREKPDKSSELLTRHTNRTTPDTFNLIVHGFA